MSGHPQDKNVLRNFGWKIAALITPFVLCVTGLLFLIFVLFQNTFKIDVFLPDLIKIHEIEQKRSCPLSFVIFYVLLYYASWLINHPCFCHFNHLKTFLINPVDVFFFKRCSQGHHRYGFGKFF